MSNVAIALAGLLLTGISVQAMTERHPEPLAEFTPDITADADMANADLSDAERTEVMTEVGAAQRQFGDALLGAIAVQYPNENLLISPASVSIALTMLLNGAAGETYTELATALGVSDLAKFNAVAGAIDGSANSLWLADGLPVLPSYRDTLSQDFAALVETVDFADPATTTRINDWVSEQTRDRIPTIVDSLDPQTQALLINAIYFKDAWLTQFDPALTDDANFSRPDRDAAVVQMMRGTQVIPYVEAEGYQLIELPYANANLSMVLVLPDTVTTLTSFLDGVSLDDLEQHLSTATPQSVKVGLPRFSAEFDTSLNSALQSIGINRIFEAADFSNLASVPLQVSDTIHKTFILVDEEGTEAAAVTGVTMTRTSVAQEPSVTFDRPFLYVIRDRDSGSPIFTGWLADPRTPVQ